MCLSMYQPLDSIRLDTINGAYRTTYLMISMFCHIFELIMELYYTSLTFSWNQVTSGFPNLPDKQISKVLFHHRYTFTYFF